MEEKHCRFCGKTKLLKDFSKCSRSKDGLKSRCKTCEKDWRRKHYLNHKAEIQAKTKAYRLERKTNLKKFVMVLYTHMRRRIHDDPQKYQGSCTKEIFYEFALKDKKLKVLYKNWIDSGWRRDLTPSIDRINNRRGYSLDNMQFLTFRQNALKGVYESLMN